MAELRSFFYLTLLFWINSFECVENNIDSTLTPDKEKCFPDYPEYGCYSIEEPWTSKFRPVSLFPMYPEIVNPKYCLYNERRDPGTCDALDPRDNRTIFESGFMPEKPTFFIAHGFIENGDKPWIKELKDALLSIGVPTNVIVIDWSGGSDPPYAQAVANIRLVGNITAHLIYQMLDVGLKVETTHIIGHSLGSHLASYVGATLWQKHRLRLGRITGLDPAEPHFQQTDPSVRLDPTDAIFVDVIHTDAAPFVTGGLGMSDPVGHVDFYPNGGRDQPGCEKRIAQFMALFRGERRTLGCSHVRSYMYFIETIHSQEKFWAVECSSWENYLKGDCFRCDSFRNGRKCVQMGFNSPKAFSKEPKVAKIFTLKKSPEVNKLGMYLITGEKVPYHRGQYRVTWSISGETQEVGSLKLMIVGNRGQTDSIDLTDSNNYFDPGTKHRMVVAGRSVGELRSAILVWRSSSPFFSFFNLNNSSMNITNFTIDSLENSKTPSLRLCLPKGHLLTADVPKRLERCIT